MISAVYYNPEIPGHSLVQPAISLENTLINIFSPIEQSGCRAVAEVIKRIVIAPFATLAFIPTVLFAVLVALPIKAVAARFLHPSLVEEDDLRPLSEHEVRVEQIPGDGNCALTAFMRGMQAQGYRFNDPNQPVYLQFNRTRQNRERPLRPVQIRNVADLRIAIARWISDNITNNSVLDGRLRNAIQEEILESMDHFEFEKTSALNATQDMATYQFLAQNGGTKAQRDEAKDILKTLSSHRSIERIDADLAKTSVDLVTVSAENIDVFDIRDLANDYLRSIQDNRRRVYAGHAHFYALAHMWRDQTWNIPANILIYEKVGHVYRVKRPVEDYRLRSSNIRGPTIRLLHASYGSVANHFNLIHLRPHNRQHDSRLLH